jgi:AcrR family transcriptional regulator
MKKGVSVGTTAERIAETALRILEASGPDEVTMRRVAQEVGITPMAIYHHFRSREDLLRAVTEAEFQQLLSSIEARRAKARRSRTKDRSTNMQIELMEGYIDYALARPRLFDYVFARPRTGARRYPADFRARKSPTLNVIADELSEGIRTGDLRKADVWEIAFGLWAHVHGYVALYRAGRIDLSEKRFREMCRRSMERLMNGLKS